MADEIYLHGVDLALFKSRYPQGRAAHIDATSDGLNTESANEFIEDGAGRVNDALAMHGLGDPENDLSVSTAKTAQSAVLSYAIAQALRLCGDYDGASAYDKQYERDLKAFRTTPERQATSHSARSTVKSNINRDAKRRFNSGKKVW